MGVGKNFLENLTVAMYENCFTVYREFIQNAADSIDKAISSGLLNPDDATIDINIDYSKRLISVHDNACGIEMRDFKKKMTDVADSEKDRDTEKGFRGIGRLAGLGYCSQLVFRTSAIGEDKESAITWDGEKLKTIVDDPRQHPSSDECINMITSIEYKPAEKNEHFFEVLMRDVTFECDELLDTDKVEQYLSAVAPAPYPNHFIFKEKIHRFADEHGFKIDEYRILLNGKQLFKPYKTMLYEGSGKTRKKYDEIKDVQFKVFSSKNGKPIAWVWYGISRFEKNIPVTNTMRCIRLRKENIQIGDENTIGCPRFFKEPRGNGYFIGELFAVDKKLIPNARRDYFNPTPAATQFEEELHYFFFTELRNLYYYASEVRSAQKQVAMFQQKEADFRQKLKSGGFIDAEERKISEQDLEEGRVLAEKAKQKIEKRKQDADSNSTFKRVFDDIEQSYKQPDPVEELSEKERDTDKKKQKYITQRLSKLNSKEQKLVSRIYGIIKNILPKDMAELIIEKIQEELSK